MDKDIKISIIAFVAAIGIPLSINAYNGWKNDYLLAKKVKTQTIVGMPCVIIGDKVGKPMYAQCSPTMEGDFLECGSFEAEALKPGLGCQLPAMTQSP